MDIAAETETRFELSFGLCRGIMQVVVLLGTAAVALCGSRSGSFEFVVQLFQLSIVAMLIVLVGLFGSRDINNLWSMERRKLPRKEDEQATLVDNLTHRLGLSPRECDIAPPLTRGRNESFIAESLMLSRSTVHAYIIRIYKKVDVHSRQELLTRIEEMIVQE